MSNPDDPWAVRPRCAHHEHTGSSGKPRGTTVKAAHPREASPWPFAQVGVQTNHKRPQLPKLRAQAPSPRAGRRGLLWSTTSAACLRPAGVHRGTRVRGRSVRPPSWLAVGGLRSGGPRRRCPESVNRPDRDDQPRGPTESRELQLNRPSLSSASPERAAQPHPTAIGDEPTSRPVRSIAAGLDVLVDYVRSISGDITGTWTLVRVRFVGHRASCGRGRCRNRRRRRRRSVCSVAGSRVAGKDARQSALAQPPPPRRGGTTPPPLFQRQRTSGGPDGAPAFIPSACAR